jgi:hypothetical protein
MLLLMLLLMMLLMLLQLLSDDAINATNRRLFLGVCRQVLHLCSWHQTRNHNVLG